MTLPGVTGPWRSSALRGGLADRLHSQRWNVTAVVISCALAAGLGLMSGRFGVWAVAAAIAVLVVGLTAVDMSLVPVLAMSATLVQARAGGVLAWSDLALAAASIVGLLMLRGRGVVALQPLIWCGLVYLVVIVPTLILNPFSADFVEWVHELFLVIGSMIVGFALARDGKAPVAFALYLVCCAAIGVWASVVAVQTDFAPVYLPGLNKNTIGGMLAAAVVIAYARPRWLRLRPWFANLMILLCALGVFASQSRQGEIGALVGVLIVTLRSPSIGRWGRRAIWVGGIPVLYLVWKGVAAQLASENHFNSAYQRLTWFAQTIEVWHTSPIFGVGLRWWYTTDYGVQFQPPNAELEVLSCVGVVGLIAFLAMFVAACWLLFRLDPVYGTIGLAVVLTRFTQAQFDLYWVAGQASLLWIVAGACYGAMVRDRAMRPVTAVERRLDAPKSRSSELSWRP